MRTHLVSVLGLTCFAALTVGGGCGAEPEGTHEPTATTESTTIVRSETPRLYEAWKVERRCALPACGGWFVEEVNGALPAIHVAWLDFAPAGLPDAKVRAAEEAPSGDLLVRGIVGQPFYGAGPVGFFVDAAYLGMPGIAASADDKVFSARCVDTICDPIALSEADTAVVEDVDFIDVTMAAKPLVDRAWLENRVEDHGALVAGHVVEGVGPGVAGASVTAGDTPAPPDRVLEASQVYIDLRAATGPCLLPHKACMPPLQTTFTRDPDLCVVFDGCTEPRVCPLTPLLLTCDAGYTRRTWEADTPSCLAVACDPAFVAGE